jgi:hypothetical protein
MKNPSRTGERPGLSHLRQCNARLFSLSRPAGVNVATDRAARRPAKSAMAKLVANDEGRNRLILFCRWLRHWNLYLRQFYDLVLRCLLWRSNTVENSFWQGSVEDEIQTISWICHRLVR